LQLRNWPRSRNCARNGSGIQSSTTKGSFGCLFSFSGSRRRTTPQYDFRLVRQQQHHRIADSTWAGMLAPAGAPADIVKRVSEEIAQIVKLPDVRARLDTMGVFPEGSSPAEFGKFIDEEVIKWGKVIKTANVTPD
jgi:hypothetical protein